MYKYIKGKMVKVYAPKKPDAAKAAQLDERIAELEKVNAGLMSALENNEKAVETQRKQLESATTALAEKDERIAELETALEKALKKEQK